MTKSRSEKVELLNKIASGKLSPKVLLQQQGEAWKDNEAGNYTNGGRELTPKQLEQYWQANPQINPLIRIHVKRQRNKQ